MIRRLSDFLGPSRWRALFFLLAGTGLASLILNAFTDDWVRPVQSVLALAFVGGALVIILSALDRETRGRWLAILLPAVGAVLLGALFLPQYSFALLGGAVGWIVAGLFIFRSRARMEYQQAIRHLRRSEYADAVRVMDGVIKAEPKNPQHYRFRAEILRLWGRLDRARRDYQQMVEIDPQSAVGYNGLAEVSLQAGHYEAALDAGRRAYALAPDDWVAAYNLGMIEDRLARSADVIEHLTRALALNVPEKRHRLLIRLYLARAYARSGALDQARAEVEAMRAERGALNEWGKLLASEQAETLRAVLSSDVALAGALVDSANSQIDVTVLADRNAP